MKFILSLVGLVLVASYSHASVGTRGGGTTESERIDNLVKDLGTTEDGGVAFKTEMIRYVRQIVALPPATKEAAQILEMARHGLIEDIQDSFYDLKDRCEVQEPKKTADGRIMRAKNGQILYRTVEKSASTEKIDLRRLKGKDRRHPSICINLPMLAREEATKKEVAGLLLHEHGRHFGFEDTDAVGRHPMALAMSRWFPALDFYGEVIAPGFSARAMGGGITGVPYYFIAALEPREVDVSIVQVRGTEGAMCPKVSMQLFPQMVEVSTDKQDDLDTRIYFAGEDDTIIVEAPGCEGTIELRYKGQLLKRYENVNLMQATLYARKPRECEHERRGDYCY